MEVLHLECGFGGDSLGCVGLWSVMEGVFTGSHTSAGDQSTTFQKRGISMLVWCGGLTEAEGNKQQTVILQGEYIILLVN